jgi:16S rRNA (cytidine1402-2'-O)-methyltransferase
VTNGRLVVCATPIGNLGDISDRLREELASADVVYAEDTRRTAKLLRHLGLTVPIVSLFAGNEATRTRQLTESVGQGKRVVLVSDAGTPTVSDPGAAAVRAVRETGHPVTVLPGPSAVTTAIALSGFVGDRFVFEGFLPRKGGERERRIDSIAGDERAVVLFASPKRLGADLTDLRDACGSDREVAVLRELTKLHEECWVGTLAAAADQWSGEVRGEVTVVLGPRSPEPPSVTEAIEAARRLVAEGRGVSEAARSIADRTGVSRREIYESLLRDQESS